MKEAVGSRNGNPRAADAGLAMADRAEHQPIGGARRFCRTTPSRAERSARSVCRRRRSRDEPHPRQLAEVGIVSPELSAVMKRGGVDDAVGTR